jgi:hypothetical protein
MRSLLCAVVLVSRLHASSIISGAPVTTVNQVQPAPVAVNQFAGWPVQTGVGPSGPGVARFALSTDSSLAPNQSVNVNLKGGVPLTLVSAANLTQAISPPSDLAEKGPRWSVVSQPAAGSQATASRAAGGPATRHVADCVEFTAGATTAPAATTQLTVNLRDGASGAGTIIWTYVFIQSAQTGQSVVQSLCGLALIGSAATAMTLEWNVALANLFEAVSLTGFDVQ